MFVPHTLKKNIKLYSFNNLQPTHIYIKLYNYNLKTITTASNNLIPRVIKKNLVKLL